VPFWQFEISRQDVVVLRPEREGQAAMVGARSRIAQVQEGVPGGCAGTRPLQGLSCGLLAIAARMRLGEQDGLAEALAAASVADAEAIARAGGARRIRKIPRPCWEEARAA
jgi:hypothetical protein